SEAAGLAPRRTLRPNLDDPFFDPAVFTRLPIGPGFNDPAFAGLAVRLDFDDPGLDLAVPRHHGNARGVRIAGVRGAELEPVLPVALGRARLAFELGQPGDRFAVPGRCLFHLAALDFQLLGRALNRLARLLDFGGVALGLGLLRGLIAAFL